MKQKKITKGKTPITIREKHLTNGNVSLYLDIYHNGKRTYEFLKLYLIPETGTGKLLAREQNKNVWQTAEAIKAQRYQDLLNCKANVTKANRGKLLLVDWLHSCMEQAQQKGLSKKTTQSYIYISNVIEAYTRGKQIMLKDIDEAFCFGFLNYLKSGYITKRGTLLTQRSAKSYYITFNTAMNVAVRKGLIPVNPFSKLEANEKIKTPESTREYLTIDDVKKLLQTDINTDTKRAFLFSCFSGLRYSDVKKLTWDNIVCDNGQYRIEIVMQKTKSLLCVPLSGMALKYMPEQRTGGEKIFKMVAPTNTSKGLQKWSKEAGITKHVTFHIARHTFATMNLTSGNDLYTTSKLLGHKSINTTTIYAKIINQKKEEAVNKVSAMFE